MFGINKYFINKAYQKLRKEEELERERIEKEEMEAHFTRNINTYVERAIIQLNEKGTYTMQTFPGASMEARELGQRARFKIEEYLVSRFKDHYFNEGHSKVIYTLPGYVEVE